MGSYHFSRLSMRGPNVLPARLAPAVLAVAFAVFALPGMGLSAEEGGSKPLRAGIIGLDTSHVVAFTKVLNGPKAEGDLAGVRVVAAYPGGSPDIAQSRDRVAEFTKQLREAHGVEIVDS